MTTLRAKKDSTDIVGSFGFSPRESAAHFVVTIPENDSGYVEIREHLSWDEHSTTDVAKLWDDGMEGQMRVSLSSEKWDAIADVARVEFNLQLRKFGKNRAAGEAVATLSAVRSGRSWYS